MELGFGVPVAGAWATPANQVRVARRAEELGYRSLWTFQRLVVPEVPDERSGAPFYQQVQDAVVPLAFLAGQTSRIRLGTAVLIVPFFPPALLAKQLATLDIVSEGRLEVGLGIGWSRTEYAAVGAAFERRGARAEEFLAALRALWTGEVASYQGEFYRLPPARMAPRPVQRPHPPLLLGGAAKPALRRAGRLADGWVSGSMADLTRIGESIEMVREAAREARRPAGPGPAVRLVRRDPRRPRHPGRPGGDRGLRRSQLRPRDRRHRHRPGRGPPPGRGGPGGPGPLLGEAPARIRPGTLRGGGDPRLRPMPGASYRTCRARARSNSPFRTPARKASHSWAVNTSAGPLRSLESRTATSAVSRATSTQPLVPLRVLFRHTARDRSTIQLLSDRSSRDWMLPRVRMDSPGFCAAARRWSKSLLYRRVTSRSSRYMSPPVFSM